MSLAKRATAEALGTALLLATVVGSGIMAQELSGGNTALALLANTIATGAALVALILTFGPVSGAHFNPAVTLADAMEGGIPWRETPVYIVAQLFGAVAGTVSAHFMFQLPAISLSRHARSGPSQVFSESPRRTGSRRPPFLRIPLLLSPALSPIRFQAFAQLMFPDFLSPNSLERLRRRCCFVGWSRISGHKLRKL